MTVGKFRLNLCRFLLITTIFGAGLAAASAPVFYVTKVQPIQNYAQHTHKMRLAQLRIALACYDPKTLGMGQHSNNKSFYSETVTIQGRVVTIQHVGVCKSA